MILDQYRALFRIIRSYWRGYGGWRTVLLSPLFHFSLLVVLLSLNIEIGFDWRKITQDTLPTTLGFGLTAYVLIFTLMGGDLHTALTRNIDPLRSVSYLAMINSTFFHALFVQSVTLIFSLVSSGSLAKNGLTNQIVLSVIDGDKTLAVLFWTTELFGRLMTVYSLMMLFSTAIAVYRLASVTQLQSRATQPPVPEAADPQARN